MSSGNKNNPEISVVLPVRNEAASLERALNDIHAACTRGGFTYEIIVSDSSHDRSPEIARENGANLVKHDKFGYGRAYIEGFKEAKGGYIVCGDPDGTYDFALIPAFVSALRAGADLVMGNRFAGKMEKGSMPFLHRYLGNPLLSWMLRVFYGKGVRDAHCGMRAITRETLDDLELDAEGMEFASEMVVKALKKNKSITEIPIPYRARIGSSKLRTFRDGWRHIRFLLLFSPLFLFFIPGLILFLGGILATLWLYLDERVLFGIPLILHPMFASSVAVMVGFQAITFAFFAKTYAIIHLGDHDPITEWILARLNLERGLLVGLLLLFAGAAVFLLILFLWIQSNFGALGEIKNGIVGLLLIVLGVQTIFASFMQSIISLPTAGSIHEDK